MTEDRRTADELYALLPALYRVADAERGGPLRALLQVIGEQVHIVDEDIARLYENWFIETCEPWVVPYLGDLVGHRHTDAPGTAADPGTTALLVPRRAVAHVVRDRRRKGTLALLASLARDVMERPARAVEFYRLLSLTQPVHLLGTSAAVPGTWLSRGRTADLRQGAALELLGGPFDSLAHGVDVRRSTSRRTPGRYNIPETGVFLWRLRAFTVTGTPALCLEREDLHRYTFSVLGNDAPLFTGSQGAGPDPIGRRALERDTAAYYGPGKDFVIRLGDPPVPVAVRDVTAADLSGWRYRPRPGTVAVDPRLGRFAIAPDLRRAADAGVVVSYRYGFSADIGGGEYHRPLAQHPGGVTHRVRGTAELLRRLAPWQDPAQRDRQPPHAVVEIDDSHVHDLPLLRIGLRAGHSLQLRAVNRRRPVLRLGDPTPGPDGLRVQGGAGSSLTLDGLLVTGNSVRVEGELAELTIRHCTLVPGWSLDPDCEPCRPATPSLTLLDTDARVTIEHSIVGSVRVTRDAVRREPERLCVSDSILDATAPTRTALSDFADGSAHVTAVLRRVTVIGELHAHTIELAEDSILDGRVRVARHQSGCLRFCSLVPESRTPRRHACQPDLVDAATQGDPSERDRERLRVRPAFDSSRYGTPAYARLSAACAREITEGAEDASEMGAFHHLRTAQRTALLRSGLDEYTPSGGNTGLFRAT
ncbi:hypothetical protein OG897_28400 [Streptomyces sp. NBC_00237]|uniref:hypothetical protein n=1 Tax=Streptomyces sp. NBC_00237 TaxID=2975687 RepID=UPI0022599C8B|nr:hypothetical protein [Streptomyces sp. NBC_00237]MCX5205367.1 hypothetical protein [Streptomyces sp. NBC_00237]